MVLLSTSKSVDDVKLLLETAPPAIFEAFRETFNARGKPNAVVDALASLISLFLDRMERHFGARSCGSRNSSYSMIPYFHISNPHTNYIVFNAIISAVAMHADERAMARWTHLGGFIDTCDDSLFLAIYAGVLRMIDEQIPTKFIIMFDPVMPSQLIQMLAGYCERLGNCHVVRIQGAALTDNRVSFESAESFYHVSPPGSPGSPDSPSSAGSALSGASGAGPDAEPTASPSSSVLSADPADPLFPIPIFICAPWFHLPENSVRKLFTLPRRGRMQDHVSAGRIAFRVLDYYEDCYLLHILRTPLSYDNTEFKQSVFETRGEKPKHREYTLVPCCESSLRLARPDADTLLATLARVGRRPLGVVQAAFPFDADADADAAQDRDIDGGTGGDAGGDARADTGASPATVRVGMTVAFVSLQWVLDSQYYNEWCELSDYVEQRLHLEPLKVVPESRKRGVHPKKRVPDGGAGGPAGSAGSTRPAGPEGPEGAEGASDTTMTDEHGAREAGQPPASRCTYCACVCGECRCVFATEAYGGPDIAHYFDAAAALLATSASYKATADRCSAAAQRFAAAHPGDPLAPAVRVTFRLECRELADRVLTPDEERERERLHELQQRQSKSRAKGSDAVYRQVPTQEVRTATHTYDISVDARLLADALNQATFQRLAAAVAVAAADRAPPPGERADAEVGAGAGVIDPAVDAPEGITQEFIMSISKYIGNEFMDPETSELIADIVRRTGQYIDIQNQAYMKTTDGRIIRVCDVISKVVRDPAFFAGRPEDTPLYSSCSDLLPGPSRGAGAVGAVGTAPAGPGRRAPGDPGDACEPPEPFVFDYRRLVGDSPAGAWLTDVAVLHPQEREAFAADLQQRKVTEDDLVFARNTIVAYYIRSGRQTIRCTHLFPLLPYDAGFVIRFHRFLVREGLINTCVSSAPSVGPLVLNTNGTLTISDAAEPFYDAYFTSRRPAARDHGMSPGRRASPSRLSSDHGHATDANNALSLLDEVMGISPSQAQEIVRGAAGAAAVAAVTGAGGGGGSSSGEQAASSKPGGSHRVVLPPKAMVDSPSVSLHTLREVCAGARTKEVTLLGLLGSMADRSLALPVRDYLLEEIAGDRSSPLGATLSMSNATLHALEAARAAPVVQK